jgi:predicted ester cyclase
MPTEGVAGLVVRFYEALHNDHDLTMIDTADDPKVVCRWSGLPELHGSGELRAAVAAEPEGFPDQAVVLEQIIVDGEDVASRWTHRGTQTGDYYGIPPTDRAVASTVLAFDRAVDGKLVENWKVFDNHDLMRQLGILPDPEGATG